MSITKSCFGTMPDGRQVDKYTIRNSSGAYVEIITYGATLQSVYVPDRSGRISDVLIGFDDLEGHLKYSDYQGMTVGRCANRIANGRFTIDGVEYNVVKNVDGKLCLHGNGEFSHAVWDAEIRGDNSVALTYFSADGTFGFPGNVNAQVIYTFTDDNTVLINFSATSDKKTFINLTNHAYFNLRGDSQGDILGHVLKINAGRFTVTDSDSIPTGELRSVKGTPFDFTAPKAIGRDIGADYDQLIMCKGYDHNFCLDEHDANEPVIFVTEPESGRTMEVFTNLPGVQLYCGNFLDNIPGKGGTVMNKHSGFCLETQFYPDSPNHPDFPQFILEPNVMFTTSTSFRFSVI
ncbi:MAG: galactose mutarotase [Clostridiales bacterium]|nr:galactose mutarotase [Clostridiales bacterium]